MIDRERERELIIVEIENKENANKRIEKIS